MGWEACRRRLCFLGVPQEYVENVLQLPLVRRDGIGRLASTLKMRIEVRGCT